MKKMLVAAALVMLSATASPHATHPDVTWTPGEFYFRVGGASTLTVSANPYGLPTLPFTTLFEQASLNGTRIVRIHVPSYFNFLKTAADPHDDVWIAAWESVFAEAETYGLHVLPVLDVWANWNTTMGGWGNNVFNVNSIGYSCTH